MEKSQKLGQPAKNRQITDVTVGGPFQLWMPQFFRSIIEEGRQQGSDLYGCPFMLYKYARVPF